MKIKSIKKGSIKLDTKWIDFPKIGMVMDVNEKAANYLVKEGYAIIDSTPEIKPKIVESKIEAKEPKIETKPKKGNEKEKTLEELMR